MRSWKNVGSDGSEVYTLGERPVGYIFYSHDGYMSVETMADGRAPYQEPDVFGGTPQERSEAISTYISYAGPFELLLDRDAVIHYIEVCSYPNWIGPAASRQARTRPAGAQHQADDLSGSDTLSRAYLGARPPRLSPAVLPTGFFSSPSCVALFHQIPSLPR